jgi:hypothetical protein
MTGSRQLIPRAACNTLNNRMGSLRRLVEAEKVVLIDETVLEPTLSGDIQDWMTIEKVNLVFWEGMTILWQST